MDLVLPTVMAALGALWCVIGLVRAIWLGLRRSARRCPGPRLSWRQRLHPLTLVYRRRCGYDLGGLEQQERCPECGARYIDLRRRITVAPRPGPLGETATVARIGAIVGILVIVGIAAALAAFVAWGMF